MVLKIEIVQTPQGVALAETVKTISEQGGSLGRGENNTWILEDPDRFLSSRHCEISFEGGQYYLTDTSTNGTFVNGSAEPVGRGARVEIRDGDAFEVGEYKFAVSSNAEVDPFSSAADYSVPASPAAVFETPASPFDSEPLAPPATFGDDFFASPSAVSEAPLTDDLGAMGTDPLAALDKVNPQPDPYSMPVSDPFSTNASAASAAESFPYGQNSFHDGGDPMSGAFELPEPSSAGLIPEGWEDDSDWLNGPEEGSPMTPRPAPPSQIPEPAPRPTTSLPIEPAPMAPSQPAPGRRKTSARPAAAKRPKLEAARMDISQPNAVVPKRKAPETTASSITAQPPARKQAPAKTRAAQLEAALGLIQAMGIDDSSLSAGEEIEIAGLVGELMPVIVKGMMNVLRSRASIKNEFRMSVTTIQPVENNPLKFSADTQEALENMFIRKTKAYKGPVEAFSEGFEAIAEHQVAIIAGIRAAFESMLEQFNPASLEQQFDKQSKGVVIPGMQKAKYWNSYNDYYTSVLDNMEQSFQNLFGDEFVRAYEDQLFKLAAARNMPSADNT